MKNRHSIGAGSAPIGLMLLCLASCICLGSVIYKYQVPDLPPLPSQQKSAVTSALEKSGENRIQLVRALARVKSSQLSAMCDMISRMPNYDLANITSHMLLDHIDCTFETNNRVPWKLATNSRLFLDYVLPYRIAGESLENSRRDISKIVYPQVKECRGPREAASKILTFLAGSKVNERDIGSGTPYDYPPLGAWKFSHTRCGWNCRARCMIAVALLRSVGIPAGIVERRANMIGLTNHQAIWFFDVKQDKLNIWETDDGNSAEKAFLTRMFHDGEPVLYTTPPYASTDLLNKRQFDKLVSLGSYTYPSGSLTINVSNNGSPVSMACVSAYVWSSFQMRWIDIYKSKTDDKGKTTFRPGNSEGRNPYMICASKNKNSTLVFLHVMPHQSYQVDMNISRSFSDAKLVIKKLN